jgi:small-conductance mechanosensitive channel
MPVDLAATTSSPGVDSFAEAVDAAVAEVRTLLGGAAEALPRVVIGLVVLGLFWLAARLARRAIAPTLRRHQGESIGRVLGSLLHGTVIAVGVLVFLAVAFPAVDVATLLGAGGVVALAAGFAFQDLLENAMSGILLLLRQPFQEGDVIEVDGAIGVAHAITIRETRIRRFDRQVMVVPNAQVYKNAIRIQTEHPAIRSSVIVGVGYQEDLQRAEDLALEALRSVDGVLDDPGPEAFFTELGGSSVNLDLRYFHTPEQHELRRVQGEVVKAVKRAYDDAGIDIPFPIRTLDAGDTFSEAVRHLAGAGSTAG